MLYEILHEDPDFVIVNKSAQVLTTPDRFKNDQANLYHLLQKKYTDIYVVHRLDKETTGVLVFARNAEAHRHLSMQFEGRKPKKIYGALVQGHFEETEGLIDEPLAPHPSIEGKMIVSREGKASKTQYTVVEEFKQFSWVECQIFTGRMHQVRVHLAYAGHPLAVDPLYGGAQALYLSSIKTRRFKLSKEVESELPLLQRVPLHALSLSFEHPRTGEWLSFEAPLPKDIRATLSQLRKWGAQ
jgi:RluA family pseudouridine synthase